MPHKIRRDEAKHSLDGIDSDPPTTARQGLIGKAQGITQAAVCRPRKGRQSRLVECDPLFPKDMSQLIGDLCIRQSPQGELETP